MIYCPLHDLITKVICFLDWEITKSQIIIYTKPLKYFAINQFSLTNKFLNEMLNWRISFFQYKNRKNKKQNFIEIKEKNKEQIKKLEQDKNKIKEEIYNIKKIIFKKKGNCYFSQYFIFIFNKEWK